MTRPDHPLDPNRRLGAYGIRLEGLAGAHAWMQPQTAGAPCLRLEVRVTDDFDDGVSRYDGVSADLRLLTSGRLRARRGEPTVDYLLSSMPPDEDLLHPYLAPAAALLWRWEGREAIHAGVFAGRAGAVLLVGDKGAGKSTTLAWLADAGVGVVSDDLAVLVGGDVLAGPRSIDLRPSSFRPPATRDVRRGERARVTLPPTSDRQPLAGVAVLEWGARLEITNVPLEQRWAMIAGQRSFPALPANPVSLLDVVAVPMLCVTRPPGPVALDQVGRALIDAFGPG